ncbi:hypothetical protein [Wenjunlia tyrosinilytica]|jgi:hypothetical protein|uniref:Uncharacterized protein n=1 Tax=Wenjunlia tyrosinilytica TaxID=1544741 RepID=A0A917ZVS9_9ACTN|nr:hypothetical protein [Wenjunlia tyrosinilytica]GGO98045.1 hypothetical protein GCM10012280_61260 [Wenjunlia tyrosinilytica]
MARQELDPDDPNFFAKFTLSDEVIAAGLGGTPLPRVTKRVHPDGRVEETDEHGDLGSGLEDDDQ